MLAFVMDWSVVVALIGAVQVLVGEWIEQKVLFIIQFHCILCLEEILQRQ